MSADPRPDVSVVIVSWNVRTLLAQCLDSFLTIAGLTVVPHRQQGQIGPRTVDIWVVDNASHDDTIALLAERYPWVRIIASERNLGFTGGNNLALRQCRGRYVLLLNPDTVLTRAAGQLDALSLLADLLDEQPSVGLVGPRLVYGDGSPQSSRRRFPTLTTALFESTLLERWFPHNRWARRYRLEDEPAATAQEMDWVTGACMLVRRQALDQVGLFDEAFFMYSEELDLCRRLRAAGWGIVHLPAATVVHYEGQSSGQVAARRQMLFDTSKVRYFAKHHGAAPAACLRSFLLSTYVISLAGEAIKWALGHKRPLRAQRIRAYIELVRGGLRPTGNAKG
jgi:hypothetical protein